MTVVKFDVAQKALAEANTIPQVQQVCGLYDGLRRTARALKDRDAEIKAAEINMNAKRKLGKLILEASKAGALAKPPGGSKARPRKDRGKNTPTLSDAGIDKNLAKSARKFGKITASEWTERMSEWKESAAINGHAIKPVLPELTRERASSKVRANNISLKEWEKLSADEQLEFLQPHNFPTQVSFNRQDSTGIEWAQWSWNPIVGCKHDCPYCYARDIAERYSDAFPHGFEPALRPYMFNAPKNTTVPGDATFDVRFKNVFTCSMADLFGRWVPKKWIELVLTTVQENPQWNFLFLTKFPKRMAEFEIPPNAWMGTTVDLQKRVAAAEAAFEKLAKHPGIKWVSVEPLLEPLQFKRLDLFNWIVIGGASKSSKTPRFTPPFPWIVDLWGQAKAAGCAVYMKTNLLGNRVLELPFDAPLKKDDSEAPSVLHYLGKDA